MLLNQRHIKGFVLAGTLLAGAMAVQAQTDTTRENKIDSLLLRQKGVLGTIAQTLMANNSDEKEKDLQRSDIPFQRYRNRVIRNITIQPVDFGFLIGDTTKRFSNSLTRVANGVHYTTRNFVLRNNLFFHENDRLSPFLMGNNERYLRDLPFLQEAHIAVKPVQGELDSVDVIIYTKDILSIGGSLVVRNTGSGRVEIKEDNFMGWGDRLEFQTLFDRTRNEHFGFGAQYIKRNILGTFIDGSAGYVNFNPAFSSRQNEETISYLRLVKPLVNPYM